MKHLKQQGLRIAATSSHKGKPIDEADLTGGLVILVGSEGAGVPREYMNLADDFIRVPHSERVESLNAAIAASVILYEAQQAKIQLKTVEAIIPVHEVQLVTYLRLMKKPVGLLINFNVPVLKDGIRRRIFNP